MTKTLTEAAPQAEPGDIDVQTVDPRRANQRKRRNLLIAVAVLAVAVVAAASGQPAVTRVPRCPSFAARREACVDEPFELRAAVR